jgi:hypothetical protein
MFSCACAEEEADQGGSLAAAGKCGGLLALWSGGDGAVTRGEVSITLEALWSGGGGGAVVFVVRRPG